MSNFEQLASPLIIKGSFDKYLSTLEKTRDYTTSQYQKEYIDNILKEAYKVPELREGFYTTSFVQEHEKLIHLILSDIFPAALTYNEIKAAGIPFSNYTFNLSERFKNILRVAGEDFEIQLRDFDESNLYVIKCAIILQKYFKANVKMSFPFYYDIPDANGVLRHYRMTINADFIDIFPTEKAIIPTEEEIETLLDNFDDIKLWKSKFLEHSWILKGFFILNLTDVTSDFSLSEFKSLLLSIKPKDVNKIGNFEIVLKSFFEVPDLKADFMFFNEDIKKLERIPNGKSKVSDNIIEYLSKNFSGKQLADNIYKKIAKRNQPLVISDIYKYKNNRKLKHIYQYSIDHNLISFVLLPIVKDGKLLAIIELSSAIKGAFNTFKVKKIDFLAPFLLSSISRFFFEWQNQLEVIIQREYTALHPSVAWRFREEAQKVFFHSFGKDTYTPKEIIFNDVYPLYGQSDIKASSVNRNLALQVDLSNQLESLINIYKLAKKLSKKEEANLSKIKELLKDVKEEIKADTDYNIQRFLFAEIHPFLRKLEGNEETHKAIELYFSSLDKEGQMFYHKRKDYDESLGTINKTLAEYIEKREVAAQKMFPHYFEMFKTDGVEHNIYIGQSITPDKKFTLNDLKRLRLWQLETICLMERKHHHLKTKLTYPLDINSLILVYNSPLSIRFRMDEKRFDIDGAYNAKYEIEKKRIDKSHIKGTTERITQTGKICIVFQAVDDEVQYREHINKLQSKGFLGNNIEKFDIEDLQGIIGLKALRVEVKYEV